MGWPGVLRALASKPMVRRSAACHSAQALHASAKAGSVEIDLIRRSAMSLSSADSTWESTYERTAFRSDMPPPRTGLIDTVVASGGRLATRQSPRDGGP